MAPKMFPNLVVKESIQNYAPHIQWLAIKLAVSVSVFRKMAVVFLFVEIQKILIKNVWKT